MTPSAAGRKRRKVRQTNRGKLVKGITKKLPSRLFEYPSFQEALKKVLGHYSGIYALYRGQELYYVGLSNNLHSRIKHHLEDRHKGKWDNFMIFRIKRANYLKDIETVILQTHQSPGNIQKGKLPKKYNLTEPFKAALKGLKREIDLIDRALK
ncbi:MAG TPA: GIY-YIG nuclease family protein [Terriglobales bacterium]|nr:GIY-YIG nuclease family protein [Terriglobales bacterium]